MYPMSVWVIIECDNSGEPRGFEKSTGQIFFDEGDAESELTRMDPEIMDLFKVKECVIMGKSYYDQMR